MNYRHHLPSTVSERFKTPTPTFTHSLHILIQHPFPKVTTFHILPKSRFIFIFPLRHFWNHPTSHLSLPKSRLKPNKSIEANIITPPAILYPHRIHRVFTLIPPSIWIPNTSSHGDYHIHHIPPIIWIPNTYPHGDYHSTITRKIPIHFTLRLPHSL